MVTYDDFAKLEIKIAKIMAAERVENTEKLLKLSIKIGEETRTIVAGIAKSYAPEDLLDKKIVVLANLEPRMIKGIESKGMLLAASDTPVLLVPDKDVEDGTRVS